MTTARFAGTLATLCLGMALVGCNPQHEIAPTHPVTGKVTHDGKPVASGTIIFEPLDPALLGTPPGSGSIADGRYELQAPAGKHIVRISSPKDTGKVDETGIALTEETIPAKYNLESELTAEVAAGTTTTKDFALTGKVEKPKPGIASDPD